MASSTVKRETALEEVIDRLLTAQKEGEPACALCRLVRSSVERGIQTLFSEFVNDPKVRDGWRRSGGFCTEHAVLAAALGDALGVAILYADLARLAREKLQTPQRSDVKFRISNLGRYVGSHFRWRGKSTHLPSFQSPCTACVLKAEAGARYAAALAAGLSRETGGQTDEAVWEALEAGDRLCLNHLQQTLTFAASAANQRLREWEIQRLAALEAELEEIVRKNDYRFRGELWGAERDAWLRALDKLRR